MQEFLEFRKMITPIIIQIVFWIGAAMCVITGLFSITGGGMRAVGGLMTMILGPIVVRIYCELIILLFRIYDTLNDIKDNTKRGQ
jgi:hypothetical protein